MNVRRALAGITFLAVMQIPCAAANAGVVFLMDDFKQSPEPIVIYQAHGGETNHVVITDGYPDIAVIDPAGIMPGRGCRLVDLGDATRAQCTYRSGRPPLVEHVVNVWLGDRDDSVFLPARPPGGFRRSFISDGPGNDLVSGTAGVDYVAGGHGNDVYRLGAGGDQLAEISGIHLGQPAVAESDRIYGGLGNDLLGGGIGSDRVFGGPGNDRVNGGPGNDLVSGDAGNDFVLGSLQNDRVYGGSGNDRLVGGTGLDRILGGPGLDFVDGLRRDFALG